MSVFRYLAFIGIISSMLFAQDPYIPPYEGSIDQQYDQLFDQTLQNTIAPDPVMENIFNNPENHYRDRKLEKTVPGYVSPLPPSSHHTSKHQKSPQEKCSEDCYSIHIKASFCNGNQALIECLEGCKGE